MAEVVSLIFNSSVYFSLYITKAKSRNKQLHYYEGDWPIYEILKRFFKSKRYYTKRIASMEDVDNSDGDLENKDAMLTNDRDSDDGEGGGDGETGEGGRSNSNGEFDGGSHGDNREENNVNRNEDVEGEGDRGGVEDGDGSRQGDEDEEGDGDEEDRYRVQCWNGKGKGKAKEGSWDATESVGKKRTLAQIGGKFKIRKL